MAGDPRSARQCLHMQIQTCARRIARRRHTPAPACMPLHAGTCCCDLLQRWRPPRGRCMGLTVGGATLVGNILIEGQCVRVSRVRRCKHASDLTPTAERVPAEKPEHAAVCRGRGASHPGSKSPAAHRAGDAQPTCQLSTDKQGATITSGAVGSGSLRAQVDRRRRRQTKRRQLRWPLQFCPSN